MAHNFLMYEIIIRTYNIYICCISEVISPIAQFTNNANM